MYIYGAYGMCSRIVALVLSVTLHILTVKNLYRVVNSSLALSNAFRSWFMAFWHNGDVQQGRDIGFHYHAHILTISNCTESQPFPMRCLTYRRASFSYS